MAVAGLHAALPSADAIPRDGRQNKKSKWDKVFPPYAYGIVIFLV